MSSQLVSFSTKCWSLNYRLSLISLPHLLYIKCSRMHEVSSSSKTDMKLTGKELHNTLTCFNFLGRTLHIFNASLSLHDLVGQNTRQECSGTISSTNKLIWFLLCMGKSKTFLCNSYQGSIQYNTMIEIFSSI